MKTEKQDNIELSGEFAASIRDFRSAVTHVAERETARPVAAGWLAPARKRRRSTQQRIALVWVCAALLCFATLPLSTHLRHAAVHPVAQAPAAAPIPESDSALLEQVDAEVSESVPSSLAPLTELDNNTASINTSNTSGSSSSDGTTPAQTERTNVAH
jgi:hypothetical protein